MSIKALRNSNGDVLINSDGKILKANHDFGKGFIPKVNALLRTPVLPYSESLSILMFGTNFINQATINGFFAVRKAGEANRVNSYEVNWRTDNRRFCLNHWVGGVKLAQKIPVYGANPVADTFSRYMIGNLFDHAQARGRHVVNDERGSFNTVLSADPTVIQALREAGSIEILLLLATALDQLNIKWDNYGTGNSIDVPVTDIYIYNRPVSDGELKHLYNKGAGNSPISLAGCLAHYKTGMAEELAVNGVLVPAFRDFSGSGNHCAIDGLPAGTNAERIDYVNTQTLRIF